MHKTIKLIAFAIIVSIPVLISSCDDPIKNPPRTAEIEQQELDYAIDKLESSGYDIDTTDLGVYYIMHKQGTGPLPQPGDTCSLIYTGFFMDGNIFDSSGDHYQDSIWQFNYMKVSLIPGFNDGIALLNKGAKADVIIPSKLAYGETGSSTIPPFTTLVFSMEMKNLRPVN